MCGIAIKRWTNDRNCGYACMNDKEGLMRTWVSSIRLRKCVAGVL